MRLRRVSFSLFAVVVPACIASFPAAAQQVNRAVVFGDSLSDNGNIASLAGGAVPNYLPLSLTRFSNGPVWVEKLLGPATNFYTTINPNTGNVNYAFGGSRTSGAQTPGPTTGQQIGLFLQNGGVFRPGDVATLWAGGNNIIQALPGAMGNPGTAAATMAGVGTAAAGDVAGQTAALAAANARTIVVLNLPNFGTLPDYAGTPTAAAATAASNAFNTALAANLTAAAAANPNANIVSVDVARVIAAAQANPAAFGLANGTQSCLDTPACRATPALWNRFLFWDGVHPTEAAHALLAGTVEQYLAAPSRGLAVTDAFASTALAARRTALLDAFSALRQFAPEAGGWRAFAFASGEAGQNSGTVANGMLAGTGTRTTRVSSFTLAGIRAGLLRNADNGWTYGLVASAATGSVDGRGRFGADVLNFSADAIGSWRSGGAFVNAGFGFGNDRFGNFAWRTVGPLTNTGSTTGRTASAGAEAGYDFTHGRATITPVLRGTISDTRIDSFNEQGLVAPLAYGARNIRGFAGAGELRVSYQLTNRLAIFAMAGYEGYLAASASAATGRIIGNTAQAFSIAGERPAHAGALVGAGLSGEFGAWTLALNWRASAGANGQTHNAGHLALAVKF